MVFDTGDNLTSILIALIAAIPAIIAAFYAYRANNSATSNAAKIDVTHSLVNGRMDELLALTQTAAHSAGVTAGEVAQRDRDTVSPEVKV